MRNYVGIIRHFLNLRKEQWLDKESLELLQRERLEKTMSHASNTPHYGRIIKDQDLPFEELAQDPSVIPPINKEDVRNNPEGFLNRGLSLSRLGSERTSGSTGMLMEFFFDQDARDYYYALTIHDQIEFGRTPSDLFFEISHLSTPPPLMSKLGIFRKKTLSVFADERYLFSALRKTRPDILAWYPSVTSIMARLNNEHGRPIRLKSVFSGAELLTKECRDLIGDSFSCPVFEQYGTTEFAVMAWECPEEHNLHVNANSILLEIVDDNGKPKKSGTGSIVATSLYNRAMPLLRYHIGDLGCWGKECSCGRGLPVLKSIQGRQDDVIILPSGRVRSARSINLMDNISGVLSYQIIQENEGLFVFRYVPSKEGCQDSMKRKVMQIIKQGCLDEEVKVEFEAVDSIKRGRTGKIRTVISKVKRRAL